jgi:hypothetical protein
MPDNLRNDIGGIQIKPFHVVEKLVEILQLVKVADGHLRSGSISDKSTRDLVLIGLLISCGNIVEGLGILRDMDPTKFAAVWDFYKEKFEVWRQMRHDAAHYMERIFRIKPERDPLTVLNESEWMVIISVDINNPSDPVIRTGNDELHLNDALAAAQEIVDGLVLAEPDVRRRANLRASSSAHTHIAATGELPKPG